MADSNQFLDYLSQQPADVQQYFRTMASARQIPTGGRRFVTPNGAQFIVFDIGNGYTVLYRIDSPDTLKTVSNLPGAENISAEAFSAYTRKAIDGGSLQELFDAASRFGPGTSFTFNDWLNKELQIASGGAAWINDPQVRAVYIDYLLNKEKVSPEELQFRIRQTPYWQNTTQAQAAWNDLSPADQAKAVQSSVPKIIQMYLETTGIALSATDPQVQQWATDVSSGKKGEGQILQEMRGIALKDSESPWSRTIRQTEEDSRQRGVDIENNVEDVRTMYEDWGIPYSDSKLRDWAQQLAEKRTSAADIEQFLRSQAQVLYPWKDPNVKTSIAAEPWLQTYSRVMERAAPSLYDPDIQRALNAGTPVYQFEQDLRRKPEWLQTKNASETLVQNFFRVGQLMGFE